MVRHSTKTGVLDMGRTVFILGAGASVRAGCPVMSDFLDKADDLRNAARLAEPYRAAFDRVFKARAQLQSVHSKARLDLHNIESVFGAFEIARKFRKSFGNLTVEDVQSLSLSMRLLIASTLELTTSFGIGPNEIIPPSSVWKLRRVCKASSQEIRRCNNHIQLRYCSRHRVGVGRYAR